MAAETISRVLGDTPSASTILKHLKEHSPGGNERNIEIDPELPMRERVLNIQRMQVDEIERRINLAKQRADQMNALHDNDENWTDVDWSEFTDIIGKEMQAAIGSILKTQGLTDKREKAVADTQVGLFAAMANAGLAPVKIVGEVSLPELIEGEVVDGD